MVKQNKYLINYKDLFGSALACSSNFTDYFIPDDIFHDTKLIIKSNKFEFDDQINQIFEALNIEIMNLNFMVFAQDIFIFYIGKDRPECNLLRIILNTEYELPLLYHFDHRDRSKILQQLEEKIPNLVINRLALTPTISTFDKGGNFLGIPLSHTYIKIYPKEAMMCEMFPDKCFVLLSYSQIEGHVDEILCFMPYGIDKFKLWFYQPINTEGLPPEVKTLINKNYEYNKLKLEAKFGAENIIYFPVEFLESGHIKSPPLFNRLSIKKEKTYTFVFPDQSAEIKELINTQIAIIKTNLSDYTININYINTTTSHNMTGFGDTIGGNLHCIVKQVMNS